MVTRKKSLKILKIYHEKSLKNKKNLKKLYKIVRKKKYNCGSQKIIWKKSKIPKGNV